MLQRFFVHFSLILLFAFTLISGSAHTASHLDEHHSDQAQDQNSHENQCGQCLSLSHIADADATHHFDFDFTSLREIFTTSALTSVALLAANSYSARAPPTTSLA